MSSKGSPFIIKVITPLHAGSGQDLGIVDLPIQRERHTSFPKIEASGLKGSIRDIFRRTLDPNEGKNMDLLFGPETSGDFAGAIGFIDARLLLFPVKSVKGTYALITCPQALNQLFVSLHIVKHDFDIKINLVPETLCRVAEESQVALNDKVILEEYCFDVEDIKIDKDLIKLLEHYTEIDDLGQKLVILSDDDFKEFVNLSTEVITRTKIKIETGTVTDGALFTEEYLPSESVLYSLAIPSSIFAPKENKESFVGEKHDTDAIMDYWQENMPQYMQIGGNATIGKGIVEIIIAKENDNG